MSKQGDKQRRMAHNQIFGKSRRIGGFREAQARAIGEPPGSTLVHLIPQDTTEPTQPKKTICPGCGNLVRVKKDGGLFKHACIS
jgi:hypothetical protein